MRSFETKHKNNSIHTIILKFRFKPAFRNLYLLLQPSFHVKLFLLQIVTTRFANTNLYLLHKSSRQPFFFYISYCSHCTVGTKMFKTSATPTEMHIDNFYPEESKQPNNPKFSSHSFVWPYTKLTWEVCGKKTKNARTITHTGCYLNAKGRTGIRQCKRNEKICKTFQQWKIIFSPLFEIFRAILLYIPNDFFWSLPIDGTWHIAKQLLMTTVALCLFSLSHGVVPCEFWQWFRLQWFWSCISEAVKLYCSDAEPKHLSAPETLAATSCSICRAAGVPSVVVLVEAM